MQVRNKRTGQTFDTNLEEWNNKIVDKELYEIVNDGSPIEIKNLKTEVIKRKKQPKHGS